MPRAKVLIVEDKPVIALDIKQRLTRLGYEVTAIVDEMRFALESVATNPPNLILMDIRLRGEGDGIEAATQIRRDYNLPVVFLTAHADEATIDQARTAYPFGYIVKPFENRDLSTAIEIALSRHQAELAIQRTLDKERHLNQLKSRFLAVVSHEFRSPLTAVRVAIDLLGDPNHSLPPDKLETIVNQARVAIRRMDESLEEILLLGAAEAEMLQCQVTPLALVDFCADLVAELTNQDTRHHNIRLETQGWDDTSMVHLDPKLLRHILTNLLSNAIKYSPAHSDIWFRVQRRPQQVVFSIQDQGIGIPPEDLARLFEAFHRGGNVSHISGTGLGLSIVKQCVDAHGGTITFNSELNVGTTFTVTLPC
ncbi:MAG: ATP-binding protein [Cyanobacteria bacterium]|nr:ATP-binding protein [Cyanobacteriota bacterium]MDW8199651.1 ATP-binding protein [Cyanobacteriota bacterium SKYGB_h_bin112]